MADKTYVLRLEMENGQVVIKGLDDIGAKGEQAGKKIKQAFDAEATPGARAFGAATTEAHRAMDQFASRLGPFGSVLRAIGPAGLAAAAGIGAVTIAGTALGRMAVNAVRDLDALGDMAGRLKINVETLQALRIAARDAGYEMEGGDAAAQALRDARLDALSGTKGSKNKLKLFGAFGISKEELTGLESLDALYARLAQGAQAMGDKAAAAAKLHKLGQDEVATALLNVEGGLDAVLSRARESGQVFDAELVKKAGDLNQKLDEMTLKWSVALGPPLIEMIERSLPTIQKLIDMVGEGIGFVGRLIAEIERMNNLPPGPNGEPGMINELMDWLDPTSDLPVHSTENGKPVVRVPLKGEPVSKVRRGWHDFATITMKSRATGPTGDVYVDEEEEEAAAKRAEADAARELADVMRTVLDVKGKEAQINARLKDTLADLAKARRLGVIASDAELQTLQDKAQRDANRELAAVAQSRNKWLTDAADKGADLAKTIKGIDAAQEGVNARFEAFNTILSGSVRTADDLLAVFLNIIAQMAQMAAMGAAKGEGSWGELFWGGITGALGLGGGANLSRSAPAINFGRRAMGGPGGPGQVIWAGEHGPEPVLINRPSWVVDNASAMRAMGGGSRAPTVYATVENHGPPMEQRTETSMDGNGDVRIRQVLTPMVREATEESVRSGKLDRAMQQRTGLPPRRVRRS